ncbi:MAG: glycosyltransferase [Chloroflexi bacterium AL-W]|nr:glycosyltransferase [Chloroflexi bacterium AL-N1]NOK70289.1 glycosyltransferase [Chloroflexi bacterium AL-N10]NOK77826.1 glycosyltransferase [Chloroflexi bacterium AL-N5]NOK84835.1 glycosyltransferase [Chloroflexi bacterium AL-W]NOK92442.1 glycosyltransferase [Chloroflexi bacterium AL-N15]
MITNLLFYILITTIVLLVTTLCMQDIKREIMMPQPASPDTILSPAPLISILIPARDEAARIGLCLEGLTSQTYRSFEVIIIDDHSSDGTADVAQRYADRLPKLSIIQGQPLPTGWVGKCWACWQAANHANGEWLIFLDADVIPAPMLLQTLVHQTQTRSFDLITLLPLQQFGSLAEKLVMPAFLSLLYSLYPPELVNKPRSPLAFTNGPCIFIRRTVYEAVGGHTAVRSSVLEDVDFGRHVKNVGYAIMAFAASHLLAIRMYDGWDSLSEGLAKNAVAGHRSGGLRSVWIGLRQALIAFAPIYIIFTGLMLWLVQPGPLGLVLLLHGMGLALLTISSVGWIMHHRYRISACWGLLYPIGLASYFGIASYAFIRAWQGHGVVWRGRIIHDEY